MPGWDSHEDPDVFDWCDHYIEQYKNMLAGWAAYRAAREIRRKALSELFDLSRK